MLEMRPRRRKRIECRRKCTEFVAWKLSMQAVRQKKKEDKNKFYSETKLKCYRRKAMKQKNWTEKVADRRLEEIGCRI